MTTRNTGAEPALYRVDRLSPAAALEALEFGRFQVLLRQRQLIADGVPVELGTRAFDLLLALLEANGSLVTKDELMSRVWPGIVVAEENLKVQTSALRKALGEDRDFIALSSGAATGSQSQFNRRSFGALVSAEWGGRTDRRNAPSIADTELAQPLPRLGSAAVAAAVCCRSGRMLSQTTISASRTASS